MLHPKSATEVSYVVAGLMEDIWDKRRFLAPDTYFVFRLEASDFKTDKNISLFAHFLITPDRWYFKLNSDQYGMTIAEMQNVPEDNAENTEYHISSWRRYAFSDLVTDYIEAELDARITAASITPSQFTIWDTFPVEEIN